jgi:hypothetical protein
MKIMKTTEQFIKEAKEIHGDRYDYNLVIYVNSKTKIKIICKILGHGKFEQTPSNHLYGFGCSKCGIINRSEKQRKTLAQFIKEAKEIHGDIYDYEKVIYINTDTEVKIVCGTHGDFPQTPDCHLRGSGCPKCGIEKRAVNRTSNTQEFIKKAKEKHGDIYNYDKVNYVGSNIKVIINCGTHGDFPQTPSNHLYGFGCSPCGIQNMQMKQRKTLDEFIKEAKEKHGDIYNYEKVIYINTDTSVTINCGTHGDFQQTPDHHLRGQGCSKCALSNYSKMQICWLNFISKFYNINIQHAENGGEYRLNKLKMDGFCKEKNTIYEFHGDFWHGNPKKFNENDYNSICKTTFGKLYQKTLEREQQIRNLGYNLVVIWEHDWNNINKSIKILQKRFRFTHH